MDDIVNRLRHSAATACNDDYTKARTEERRRHADQVSAMLDAADEIEHLRKELEEARLNLDEVARAMRRHVYVRGFSTCNNEKTA